MLCHFIYSIAFSSYALLFCRYLCPMSIEENYYSTENVHLLSFSSMANHFSQKIVCNLTQNYTSIDDYQVSQVFFTPTANIAIAIWISLIFFTVLMTMRELTEFYDQGAYNWYEADTWIHIFIMVMFALCSFILLPDLIEVGGKLEEKLHLWSIMYQGVCDKDRIIS